MTTDELENYTPKGQLEGFPKEIIARMLECQQEQGNKRDVTVFEKYKDSAKSEGGFDWDRTKEADLFWREVIIKEHFNVFFEKYPKQGVCSECKECRKQEYQESKTTKYVQVGDNDILSDITSTQSSVEIEINTNEEDSQKFRVGDKVINIITSQIGVVQPKKQENRWRAERNRLYYFINFYTKDWFFSDETKDCYDPIDNENYNSGNYFRTEVEAEIIAQKLNSYFKQLIKEEHEHERN